MNNPNPFVPKGSLLEQQSARRSRLKLAVFCVLAVCVTSLVAMLIQGCKREQPTDNTSPDLTTNTTPSMTDTNPVAMDTNPPIVIPPPVTNPPPLTVITPVDNTGSEYVIVAGDTLGKIAKKNGVSLAALQAANQGVDSKHLKIKQKIIIPASTKSADVSSAVSTATGTDMGGELYTIKSGDTLDKIAKAHHTNAKAIQALNNLTTTKILVGHKLKIPGSAAAAPAVVDTAPAVSTLPPPAVSTPAPMPVTPPTK